MTHTTYSFTRTRLRAVLTTLFPIAFLAFLLAFAARPAEAATITVCNSGCDATLVSTAVAIATSGDTISIAPGTYTESGTIFITGKDLVIEASDPNPQNTVLQADTNPGTANYSVFTLAASGTSTVTIRNVTIQHGSPSGGFGGGILNSTTNNLTLENIIVTSNSSLAGGGIYNASNLTLRDTRVMSNSVNDANGGGGIFNTTDGTVTIEASTLDHNTTTGNGGAIRNNNGQITVTNSTLSLNNANGLGGAIYNDEAATVGTRLRFTTVASNTAGVSPGIFNAASGTSLFTMTNSILTNHGGSDCNFSHTTGSSNNLTDDASCTGRLGSVTGFDATLADNGGATPTHALQNSSNAIDLADACPTSSVDQRGEARDDLACDIGAFELVFTDDATVSRSTGNTPAEIPGSFGPTLVNITAVNSGDPGTVVITKTTQPPGGGVPDVDEMPVTWYISATGSTYDVNLLFCYTDAELGALAPSEAGLQAFRWDTNTLTWQVEGTLNQSDPVNNCVIVEGISEFSAWTIAANTPSAVTISHTAAQPILPLSTPWLLVGLLTLLTLTAVGLTTRRA